MARPRDAKCPKCGSTVPDTAGDGWWTLRASMPEEVRPLYDEVYRVIAKGIGERGLHRSPRIASGQVVEVLCASYLAGARDHARGLQESREGLNHV